MNSFGEILRFERERKGLSQEELGQLINAVKSTISQYELGKRKPDIDTLQQFADIFNCHVDYLLGRTDKKSFQPSTKELEEILRTSNVQFDGAPLDDTDKEEVLDFLRYIWPKLKNKKQ